jgi:hypothetical protein
MTLHGVHQKTLAIQLIQLTGRDFIYCCRWQKLLYYARTGADGKGGWIFIVLI